MQLRNEAGLFRALEVELRKAHPQPLDCATLYDMPNVREHAASVNRVSDYLGNLWRKGLVQRLAAPRMPGTKARWMYVWKNPGPVQRPPPPPLSEAIDYDTPRVSALLSRPNLEITEEGDCMVITMPHISITIKKRE